MGDGGARGVSIGADGAGTDPLRERQYPQRRICVFVFPCIALPHVHPYSFLASRFAHGSNKETSRPLAVSYAYGTILQYISLLFKKADERLTIDSPCIRGIRKWTTCKVYGMVHILNHPNHAHSTFTPDANASCWRFSAHTPVRAHHTHNFSSFPGQTDIRVI